METEVSKKVVVKVLIIDGKHLRSFYLNPSFLKIVGFPEEIGLQVDFVSYPDEEVRAEKIIEEIKTALGKKDLSQFDIIFFRPPKFLGQGLLDQTIEELKKKGITIVIQPAFDFRVLEEVIKALAENVR